MMLPEVDLSKEFEGILEECVSEGIKVILDKFNDGYLTGYHWPDEWKYRPGGPWIYSCGCQRGRYFKTECPTCGKAEQSRSEHAAWMKGWDLGHAKKLVEGRNNPRPTSEEIRAFNEGKRRDTLYA